MRSLIIEKENKKYVGQNIYKVISNYFPNLTVGNLNKLFRVKDVKINKIRVTKEYVVSYGDVIEIYLNDDLLFGTRTNLKRVYEDENILAVYKPAKMFSCNETHKYTNTQNSNKVYLEQLVRNESGNNLNICHRLDTNTEGIVLFAKNDTAYSELLSAFKNHKICKKYLTCVFSKPPKPQDILIGYLVKNSKDNFVTVKDKEVPNGEKIITEYNIIKYNKKNNTSLLEITLHTGKTHQIRAHMKHIGCPVIGDPKYSTNEINKLFKVNSQVLIAYKYKFNLDKISYLSYLNDIEISIKPEDIELLNKIQ
ncbi:MAG: RluA family pseudouridine synthase [Clostridia bacterium]|nr:RluA family pseudouridine synthase [Clostridia bacterium]